MQHRSPKSLEWMVEQVEREAVAWEYEQGTTDR
jgi:hypothetical protein